MKLILLGAPGAGKGTQSVILSKMLNIPVVATGTILRAAMEHGTALGARVKTFMEEGSLVPDDIILEIVSERLAMPDCQNGFVLDGVPRTIVQAEGMEQSGISEGAKVLALEVSREELQKRIAGRRVCIQCGLSYHVLTKPPAVEDVCDVCGGTVIQRDDDEPEMAAHRLQIYREASEPLKEFYRQRGALIVIQTEPVIEATTRVIAQALGL